MVNISRETSKKNGIETIVDNDGILWFWQKIQKNDQIIIICKKSQKDIIQITEKKEEPKKNVIEFS